MVNENQLKKYSLNFLIENTFTETPNIFQMLNPILTLVPCANNVSVQPDVEELQFENDNEVEVMVQPNTNTLPWDDCKNNGEIHFKSEMNQNVY